MLCPVLRPALCPPLRTAAFAATATTTSRAAPHCLAHPRLLHSNHPLRPLFAPSFHRGSAARPAFFPSLLSRPFAAAASPTAPTLSWDEFLRLRRQRRLAGLIASIPASMLGLYAGWSYFGTQEIDAAQTIHGMDPLWVNAAFIAGCGLFGWLIGPSVGRGVWHLVHRNQGHLVTEVLTSFPPSAPHRALSFAAADKWQREAEFFKHIQKNRADPSFQSYSNPVPDYYGMNHLPASIPLTLTSI